MQHLYAHLGPHGTLWHIHKSLAHAVALKGHIVGLLLASSSLLHMPQVIYCEAISNPLTEVRPHGRPSMYGGRMDKTHAA